MMIFLITLILKTTYEQIIGRAIPFFFTTNMQTAFDLLLIKFDLFIQKSNDS